MFELNMLKYVIMFVNEAGITVEHIMCDDDVI